MALQHVPDLGGATAKKLIRYAGRQRLFIRKKNRIF